MKEVIIIPTYNEKENIKILIPKIFSFLPSVYVVVVDDNSPDGTANLVSDLRFKYPHLSLILRKNKEGLGKAYVDAFSQVLKDKDVETIVMMDADLSHDPKYLQQMFEKSKKYSVVVGSRYINGGETVGWEFWRRSLSYLGNFYCRNITSLPIYDCTGGFNLIKSDLLRKIDFNNIGMSGYAFIMELKYLLYRAGGEFFEIPITFVNRVGGESKISGHIISEGIIAPWKIRFIK